MEKGSVMSSTVDALKVVVLMEVGARLGGLDKGEFMEALNHRLGWAVGDGLLTGNSEVEVDTWGIEIKALEGPEKDLTESAVEEWVRGLMESGSMRLEDVPKLLARYALASAESARAEIAERMGLV